MSHRVVLITRNARLTPDWDDDYSSATNERRYDGENTVGRGPLASLYANTTRLADEEIIGILENHTHWALLQRCWLVGGDVRCWHPALLLRHGEGLTVRADAARSLRAGRTCSIVSTRDRRLHSHSSQTCTCNRGEDCRRGAGEVPRPLSAHSHRRTSALTFP